LRGQRRFVGMPTEEVTFLQHVSAVSTAVSPKARNVEVARRSVAFFSSPVAAEAMKSSGLDLPAASRWPF